MLRSTIGSPGRATLATVGALTALAAGIATDTGEARGVPSALTQLRIEGPKANLDPGTWYVTDDEALKRSRGLACRHRKGTINVPGPSALGIAETASDASDDLPPVRVRPDDFGLFVCEIGGFVGRPFDHPDGFSGWTYWVDYTGGTQAAELELLGGGEEVLWVFTDFNEDRARNTGDALELTGVPASEPDGEFTVQVLGHAFDGTPTPLEGATIQGAEEVTDLGGGEYAVTADEGISALYATKGRHIPSNRVKACVRPDLDDCPLAHGRTIVGSGEGDILEGTDGWDRIRSRGGNDYVLIDGPGRDRVSCGAGEDEVTVIQGDADNEISASCEQVNEVE